MSNSNDQIVEMSNRGEDYLVNKEKQSVRTVSRAIESCVWSLIMEMEIMNVPFDM